MNSIVSRLLATADLLEKTASEAVAEESAKPAEGSKAEESKKDESKKEESKKEESDQKKPADAVSEEAVKALQEELEIDSELAEKVASSDPSVVALLKNKSMRQVESMGEADRLDKTASEDLDPLTAWLMT